MGLQITHVQTKFGIKEMVAAGVTVLASAGIAAVLTLQAGALSPGTVVVTPSNEASLGWTQTEAGAGKIDYVNSPGAMGPTALEFRTTTDGDYTRMRNNTSDNFKLSSVNTMSYLTKQISGNPDLAAVNLRLYVDTDANGTFDDVLVYEPYYNGTLKLNDWQTWNITQTVGKWWSNNGDTYSGMGGVSAGSPATNFTLQDVVSQYPSAKVDEFGLGTGTSNYSWVVQADALKINDTTFDFDKANVATNKEDCKDGGYMNFYTAYKNQGQCVSAAASKSK